MSDEQGSMRFDRRGNDDTGFGGDGMDGERLAPIFSDDEQVQSAHGRPGLFGRLKNAFPRGWPRVLISLLIAVSVFGMLYGYISSRETATRARRATVEHPAVPKQKEKSGAPVTKEESSRHARQAAEDAEAAYQKNESYQPRFEPFVVEDEGKFLPESDGLLDVDTESINREREGRERRKAQEQARKQALFAASSGTSRVSTPDADVTTPPGRGQTPHSRGGSGGGQSANTQLERQQLMEAQRRYEQEKRAAEAERDRYTNEIRQSTARAIANLVGDTRGGPAFGPAGSYSYASYQQREREQSAPQEAGMTGAPPEAQPARKQHGRVLIKAGSSLYATLDSEANTDESNVVFATIHGGQWDGARIFGTIKAGQENMTFSFSKLAPQDGRPTMSISAVALREEDAKQGMASTVDHHTLSRYTALAAASLLAGYGRAYSRPTGDTVVTGSGTVVTTNRRVNAREANASALGEVGQAFSQEVRRGFNRPTTFSTPASTGFALFFLEDVRG